MGGLRVRYRSGSRAACAGRGRSCAFSHGGRSDGGPSASAITVSGPTYAISPVLTSTKPGSLPVAKTAPYGLCITLSNAFFATALHPARLLAGDAFPVADPFVSPGPLLRGHPRSHERRVGTEWGRTCSSRGVRYHKK